MKGFIVLILSLFTYAGTAHAAEDAAVNLRLNPVGTLLGVFNLNADFKVGPEWSVGPAISYYQRSTSAPSTFTEDYKVTAFGFGARANWFKNGAFHSGLYVGPSLQYVDVKVKTKDSGGDLTGSANGLFAGAVVGYGWFWDSFNIMLGGGAVTGLGETKIEVKSSSGNKYEANSQIAGLTLEFSLGWAF